MILHGNMLAKQNKTKQKQQKLNTKD
jgi:hypothetical protein